MAKKKKDVAAEVQVKEAAGQVLIASCLQFPVIFEIDGKKITIAGNAENLRGLPKGTLPQGGVFGLTPVSKNAWEKIQKKYKEMSIFKNGQVFASSNKKEAKEEIKKRETVRSGYEPAEPEKSKTKPQE